MNNTIIIIVIIVLIATLFCYVDIRKSRDDTKELLQDINQQLIDVMKVQAANEKFRNETESRRCDIMEDVAVNIEDKQNALRQDFEFFTSDIESWKVPIQNHSEMVQREYLERAEKEK